MIVGSLALLVSTTAVVVIDEDFEREECEMRQEHNEIMKHKTRNAITATSVSSTIYKLLANNSNGDFTTSMEPLQRTAVKNKIAAHTQFQPRNVMISRMRSLAGRGMNEKYKVDWGTVLGEGAFGSVHPARLALTGEKVNVSCVFPLPFLDPHIRSLSYVMVAPSHCYFYYE